jgi:hypothetical protein
VSMTNYHVVANGSTAVHDPAERGRDTTKEAETPHRRTRSKSIARQGAAHTPDSSADGSMSPLQYANRSLSTVDYASQRVGPGVAVERAASASPARM